MFFPLFFLSFLCPCSLFACVFHLQIFMPLGIYTPKSLFCHCRLAYPFSNTFSCPFLCRVCLTLSVFLDGTSSSVLQVLSKGQSGSSGTWDKKDTHIYILCLLVNMTLACLLLMHCCSMHTVPGGAGHVWFIWCVPHTGRGLWCQLSVFLSEGVCRVSPPHWLTAEVTDRALGTGVFMLMADVAIWHSLNLAHMLTEWKHISLLLPRCRLWCWQPHLEILLFTTSIYMWITCGVSGSYFSGFIVYLTGVLVWQKYDIEYDCLWLTSNRTILTVILSSLNYSVILNYWLFKVLSFPSCNLFKRYSTFQKPTHAAIKILIITKLGSKRLAD